MILQNCAKSYFLSIFEYRTKLLCKHVVNIDYNLDLRKLISEFIFEANNTTNIYEIYNM